MESQAAEGTEPSYSPRHGPSAGFIATSVVASSVGAIVAVLIDHLGVVLAGLYADRQPVMFVSEVVFRAGGSDLAWAGGVVSCLIVGGFLLAVYPSSRRHNAARLMVLWVILHVLGRGFLQLLLGRFDAGSPVVLAGEVFGLGDWMMWLASGIGLLGLLGLSLASAAAFLAYARRQGEIADKGRRVRYVGKLGVLPGIAGPILAVPFFMADGGATIVRGLPLAGLFMIVALAAAAGATSVRITIPMEARPFSVLPVVWYVVLILVAYFALERGLIFPPDLMNPFLES